MILRNIRPNSDAVLFKYLRLVNSNITYQEVADELSRHPDYPNLLALNDVSRHYGMPVNAYKITKDDLVHVPCPFIAHTSMPRSEFLLVTNISRNEVIYNDQISDNKKIPLAKFSEQFTGVVLAANEEPKLIKRKGTSFKFSFEPYRYSIGLTLLILSLITGIILLSFAGRWQPWQTALLIIIKTVGLATTTLLLVQSINMNNPLIQTLCGTGKNNCNAILSSNAANVFDGLSWSEVGFFYFASTWLMFFLTNNSPLALKIISILNLLSLPYTVYSIYHQARVAKQWCVLCCTVQALLGVEFLFSLDFLTASFPMVDPKSLATIFISLIIPVAIWFLIKPILMKLQQLGPLKQQLRKFKYNTEIFDKLLHEQPKFVVPDETWSIVLGNVEASHIVTMVSNPYCPPCARAHQKLDEWLSCNDDIQLRIVFNAKNSINDRKAPVARHLMALNGVDDKLIIKQALNDWYAQKQKNYEEWAKAYPVKSVESTEEIIDKQQAWCEIADIKATPSLLINGYRLPEDYQLQEIKYLL